MAIKISGSGIDMGNTPVSNLDVGALDYNAVNKDYVDNNIDIGAITSYSQISGTNAIEGTELTNNIHNIFRDGSCVATYRLDGNANDLGGTYNGTASNVTYEKGKFGQAGRFNGSNSKITTSELLGSLANKYTISLWFKTTHTNSTMFDSGTTTGSSSGGKHTSIFIDNGVIKANVDGGYNYFSGTSGLNDNKWHHCVVQKTSTTTWALYVDGVWVENLIANAQSYVSNKTTIGGDNFGTSFFNGLIDQVRIFNRVLTAQEISTLYLETRVSEDATLNINQGTFIYPKGLTPRGYAKSSDTFTGTVPTSGVSDGWKYIAKDENNNFSFYATKPTLGKTSAELYLEDGKLYKSSDDTEITPISFLSNRVRFASSVPLELAPSEIAKSVTDTIEAKEVFGKNQCTAWVNFDGTTTPPTIRDSYNVSSVVRTTTGYYDIYFETPMDNVNYVWAGQPKKIGGQTNFLTGADNLELLTDKLQVYSLNSGALVNNSVIKIVVFGGKN